MADTTLALGVDSSQVKSAGNDLQKFAKDGKEAERSATRVEKSTRDMGRSMADIKRIVAGLSIGLVFKKFVDETMNAQRQQAQLAAVIRSTGEAAGYTAAQMNEMAKSLSGRSVFSVDEITSAQTRLLAYSGIVGENVPRAMQAVIDTADRMGMAVSQAAEVVGRALDVPSEGLSSLSRQGFRFTEQEKKLVEALEKTGRVAEAQQIVLKALESSYGGAAAASRDSFGGSLAALKNQLNDLMTGSDGNLHNMTGAVNDLTRTLGSDETKQAFATFVSGLASITEYTVKGVNALTKMIATFAGGFKETPEMVQNQLRALETRLGGLKDDGYVARLLYGSKEFRQKEIDEIEAQIRVLRDKLTNQSEFSVMDFVAPTVKGKPKPPPPLLGDGKETPYDKAVKALREQIALIGKKTEAEKIAAQIELGNFGKLNAARQETLKGLATSLDAAKAKQEMADTLAKLFEDNELTRAAKFQTTLEALNESFASGKVNAEEYAAAMHELVKTAPNSGADQFIRDQERLAELIDAGPAEALKRQRRDMELLAEAYQKGTFGIVGSGEAFKAYGELVNATLGNIPLEAKTSMDAMAIFAEQAGRNIQDSLGTTLSKTLKGDFDNIGDLWKNLLIDMAAQAMAMQLNQYLFGDFDKKTGSWSGKLGGLMKSFGGFFADGGSLGAGKWGIAGERGPEIIKGPAQIVPMGQGGGMGGGVAITNNVTAGIGRNELMTAMQMTQAATEASIMRALRNARVV